MGISPARRAAFLALRAMAAGADLPHALAGTRDRLADARDRALTSDIVTGTVRWRAALDHVIGLRSRRPLADVDPAVLDILRLGAYQLGHLTRVPARAVVDEAVDLARLAGRSAAAGFVNAVLRRLASSAPDEDLPARPETSESDRDRPPASEAALDYLSITLSHPRWLVARWLNRIGFEATERRAVFNNTPAGVTLCANRLRTDRDRLAASLAAAGVATRPARFAPSGLVVEHGRAGQSAVIDEGLGLIQDEGSQLVVEVAGARAGDRVLDLCASPGGKTVGLCASVGSGGLVVASDLRPARVELLARTLARCLPGPSRIARLDASQPLPFGPVFDLVLLDAPCSGLGTIRRDPDLKWTRLESDLRTMAEGQGRMIRRAAAAVAPGGRLVYATCSSEPEENDEVVDRFLGAADQFALAGRTEVASRLPGGCDAMVDGRGLFRTEPSRDGLEAFFAAVLIRRRA